MRAQAHLPVPISSDGLSRSAIKALPAWPSGFSEPVWPSGKALGW